MRRQSAAARMCISLSVKTDDTEVVAEFVNRRQNRRPFAKTQKARHIGEFRRPRRMRDLDDLLSLSIVHHGGDDNSGHR
jgi:hypothetical protein